MRFRVLACDYDGTIASDGVIKPAVARALGRVRESGRRLLLVTGRTRAQLEPAPAGLDLFDLLVLENGALLVEPGGGGETLLCPPVPGALVRALREAGVEPLHVGRALCGTGVEHLGAVTAVLGAVPLDLGVSLNRRDLMILPAGVDKASGTEAALRRLGESLSACVAVGDADNDIPLLAAAGCGVAVGSPADAVRAAARLVVALPDGEGVIRLAEHLVADDLATLLAVCASAGAAHPR